MFSGWWPRACPKLGCGQVSLGCCQATDKRKLHRKVLSRSAMSRKHRYLRYFRTFNPRMLPGGCPPTLEIMKIHIFIDFKRFWKVLRPPGASGSPRRHFQRVWAQTVVWRPRSGQISCFLGLFLAAKTGPEGSGRLRKPGSRSGSLESGLEASQVALRPLWRPPRPL